MHYEAMSIHGLLEHVQTQRGKADMSYHVEQDEETRKAIGNYRIITTMRGLCNDCFMTKSSDSAIFGMGL